MELVNTMEINGEEREIADAYARGQIDGINNNLDGLGYRENTGSGNLFREEYKNDSLYVKKSQYQSYLKTNIKGITKLYATVKLKGTSQSNYSCSIGNTDILDDKRFLNYGNISIQEYDFGVDDGVYIQIGCSSGVDVNTFFENYEIIISDSIITSDTQYKPYIPSVKMLAEEVSAQNDSLEEQGLLNKAIWNDGSVNTDTGAIVTSTENSIYSNEIPCKSGDRISVDYDFEVKNVYTMYYNGNTYIGRDEIVAPSNTTHCRVNIRASSAINKTSARVYVNNAIDELKNDLSAYADGTKAVAKATTAESATKATQDGNGNIIADTYLRKTDSTNVLLPIGSMIMCNEEQISQYYGTWVDLGRTTITCTTGTGEDIMDITYTVHVFSRTA